MTKAAKKGAEPRVADQIIQGLKEAVAFARGEKTVARVDRVLVTSRHAAVAPAPMFTRERIIDLRTNMGLSQDVFASALNVSRETVRAWEQGKNVPGGPALRLLEIADEHPDLIVGRVQVKGFSDSGTYRTVFPKPTVIQDAVPRLVYSNKPKVIAAKRNPLGTHASSVSKKTTGMVSRKAAFAKASHGTTKGTKAVRKK